MTQTFICHSLQSKSIRVGNPHPYKHKSNMIADSQVIESIRILKAYSEDVMKERGELYWEAMKANNEDFASKHLQRYHAAAQMGNMCEQLKKLYRESK